VSVQYTHITYSAATLDTALIVRDIKIRTVPIVRVLGRVASVTVVAAIKIASYAKTP
jgi:hypothetical protein